MIWTRVSACGAVGALSTSQQACIVPRARSYNCATRVLRSQPESGRQQSAHLHVATFKKTSQFIPEGEFQPRLLTHKLQKAQHIDELQQLWDAHREQFNPIHLSALMKQLAVLHGAASSGQRLQQPSGGQHATESAEDAFLRLLQNGANEKVRRRRSSHRTELQQCDSTSSSQHANEKRASKQRSRQRQHTELAASQTASRQQQQQEGEQQNQSAIDATKQLAQTVATCALQPGQCEQLDGRAVVMIAHSLAKVGVADPQLLQRLVQVTGPSALSQLDAQQLTNLIWSLAVGTATASGGAQNSYTGLGAAIQAAPSAVGTASRFQLPCSWLLSAANALQQQFYNCTSQGLAMSLWGFAQIGFRPDDLWWTKFWEATESQLVQFSGQDLALTVYACGKLKAKVPDPWLSSYLSASCAALPSLSPQQLTMSVWGLAAASCQPDKAWLMLWFLESRTKLHAASTQDLCVWMYSLAVLRITPSPLWCTSYVEASFERLTAASTAPQELVNVMWAISCMSWSPPMLYWKGLLAAAAAKFSSYNAHDLANCISAATVVDVNSIEKRWLTAFLQACEPRLCTFLPVHLAHTVRSLVVILQSHPWACLCIQATWQAAFVRAASANLTQGAFSRRNLQQVVDGLKQLKYQPVSEEVAVFLETAEVSLRNLKPRTQQGMSAVDIS